MEPINHLRDQPRDLKLLENFLLRVVIVNNFVKTIALFRIVIVLENRYFILVRTDLHHVCFMVFIDLLADQWPDPNRDSYV